MYHTQKKVLKFHGMLAQNTRLPVVTIMSRTLGNRISNGNYHSKPFLIHVVGTGDHPIFKCMVNISNHKELATPTAMTES